MAKGLKTGARKRAAGGGRKPAGSAARVQISMKMDPDLFAFIDGQARKNGWDRTQEIEGRLRNSRILQNDDPYLIHLFHLTRELNNRIGTIRGKSWHSDAFRAEAFRIAVNRLIEMLKPTGDASIPDDIRDFYQSLPGGSAFDTPEQFANAVMIGIRDQLESKKTEDAAWRRRGDPMFEVIRESMNKREKDKS